MNIKEVMARAYDPHSFASEYGYHDRQETAMEKAENALSALKEAGYVVVPETFVTQAGYLAQNAMHTELGNITVAAAIHGYIAAQEEDDENAG